MSSTRSGDGTAVPVATPAATSRRRELTAATVGSVVESFDWNMYAVLAPFFAAQLFPGGDSGALLVAYAGYAVGFVARPVGGALIGRLADRRGRRFGLTLGMTVIAAASLLLALVPDRASIGIWAAVLVVAARLVQGLAYGGEAPTVAAYVTETAPPRHRYLFSAVSYGGIILGSLLSFGVVALLSATLGPDGLAAGGWRWGFVLAAVIGVAAVWVRRSAPESDAFAQEVAAHGVRRPALRTVFTEHRPACAALFLLTIGGSVGFYFSLVYLPVYADRVGAADRAGASAFMTVVFVLTLAAMLAAGALMDRAGVVPVLRGGFAALLVGVPALVVGMQAGVLPFPVVAMALGALIAVPLATINVLSGLVFPTAVRAVGAGIVGTVGVALFGGTFPLVAEALAGAGAIGVVPFAVAGAMVLSLVGTVVLTRVPGFTEADRPLRSARQRS